MKLYVIMASADKGLNWLVCKAPFCTGVIAAEDKKTAQSMLEKEYTYMKKSNSHIAKKYFKIVEFKEVEELI